MQNKTDNAIKDTMRNKKKKKFLKIKHYKKQNQNKYLMEVTSTGPL